MSSKYTIFKKIGIKMERKFILKRTVILLTEQRPPDPEEFLAETLYDIERKLLSREKARRDSCVRDRKTTRLLLHALSMQPCLKTLNSEEKNNCVDYFTCLHLVNGKSLLPDELRENLFVVSCGEVEIIKEGKLIGICHKGDSFGSIDGSKYMTGDIVMRARQATRLWLLPQVSLFHALNDPTAWKRAKYIDSLLISADLKEHFCGTPEARQLTPYGKSLGMKHTNCECCSNQGPIVDVPQRYYNDLNGIPANLFGANNILPPPMLLKCLDRVQFEDGHIILRQGQNSRNFYYILSGRATVLCETNKTRYHEMYELGQYDHFGEFGFMFERPAPATIRATKDLTCLRINTYFLDDNLSQWFDYEVPFSTTQSNGKKLCACCCCCCNSNCC